MSVPSQTTIVALATPVGISGIAVIRVSGPLALSIAGKLSGLPKNRFRNRYAVFCPVRDPDGHEIDRGVLTFYRGPRSYTGEDVLEVSSHGGTVIPNRILEACFRLGCEPAGPGDFTRRAFLNGKLDLSQAEAVADVISAKTGVSHQVSYRILSGNFSALIHQMKADLLRVVSIVEAELDFSTDEIEPMPRDTKREMIDTVLQSAHGLLNTYSTGRLLRDGATVSIIGRPNVGKSSLLNAIISEERVIVTDHPGTTRDAVEVYYQLDGVPVSLIDTAGLASTDDPIEQRGIQFSHEFITKSDLVLWVFDITERPSDILEDVSHPFFDAPFLVVLNKADLLTQSVPPDPLAGGNGSPPIVVSALKKTGVDVLARRLINTLVSSDLTDEEVLLTNARHKKALEDSVRSLTMAQQLLVSNGEDELVAFQIRDGLSHLDRILGITTANDILDNIFSTFCVGK